MEKGEDLSSVSTWMAAMRGTAATAIVIHHWLLLMPYKRNDLSDVVTTATETCVHLFFVLSGWGLTQSYFTKGHPSWRSWAVKRFKKIILPYWIMVTLTFFLAQALHRLSPALVETAYGWESLLACLSLTRNAYPPAWGLNGTLWFMPVLVGLYALFPFLINILQKGGLWTLLLISAGVSYGSIGAAASLGYGLTCQEALPFFFVIEFSLGMGLGHMSLFSARHFKRLLGFPALFLGAVIALAAWTMGEEWDMGWTFSGSLTALGLSLMTLNLSRWVLRWSPEKGKALLFGISRQSYLMYLVHAPLIVFLAKPLFLDLPPVGPYAMMVLAPVYAGLIYGLAKAFSPLLQGLDLTHVLGVARDEQGCPGP